MSKSASGTVRQRCPGAGQEAYGPKPQGWWLRWMSWIQTASASPSPRQPAQPRRSARRLPQAGRPAARQRRGGIARPAGRQRHSAARIPGRTGPARRGRQGHRVRAGGSSQQPGLGGLIGPAGIDAAAVRLLGTTLWLSAPLCCDRSRPIGRTKRDPATRSRSPSDHGSDYGAPTGARSWRPTDLEAATAPNG